LFNTANHYALLLGMPGTGKTTTIVHTIRALLSLGFSILLTSYTHSAVDNVLLKLLELDVDFLRLGSYSKVHPAIKLKMLKERGSIRNASDLATCYNSHKLVATTALGVNHHLFSKRKFDFCIVDEA
jgi:DNA replication ATP-dependent helicase Dna2